VAEYFVALIARAEVGDVVTMLSDGNVSSRIGRRAQARRWIAARCASTSTDMLGCQSCRQPLANLTQLLWHLETAPDQTHTLARLCGEHGWEAL
jgi:hypothetical protein